MATGQVGRGGVVSSGIISRGVWPGLIVLAAALAAVGQTARADLVQQQRIHASDPAIKDFFGTGVDIDGDYAIVGAAKDDHGGHTDAGSAYVFHYTGGAWSQVAKLTASDAADTDFFGEALSISDGVAIVGAYWHNDVGSLSGAAYVFVRPAGGWADMTQTAKLSASDAEMLDIFGASVSISGDYAIVGSMGDDDGGTSAGAAYVFAKPAGGWVDMTETAKLTASDPVAEDVFGSSVAISGDTAVTGAPHPSFGTDGNGSAYVFARPSDGWADMTETAKLTASDGVINDMFGSSVAISGDTVIAGAYRTGPDTGSAYVFARPGGGWGDMTETAKLTVSDGA
ncbi:hypothetical protein LCGC14_2371310, partial [marine sediment metagenome]